MRSIELIGGELSSSSPRLGGASEARAAAGESKVAAAGLIGPEPADHSRISSTPEPPLNTPEPHRRIASLVGVLDTDFSMATLSDPEPHWRIASIVDVTDGSLAAMVDSEVPTPPWCTPAETPELPESGGREIDGSGRP